MLKHQALANLDAARELYHSLRGARPEDYEAAKALYLEAHRDFLKASLQEHRNQVRSFTLQFGTPPRV